MHRKSRGLGEEGWRTLPSQPSGWARLGFAEFTQIEEFSVFVWQVQGAAKWI